METDTLTFQAAFARLLTDRGMFLRFETDPVGVSRELGLDEEQSSAIRAMDPRRLRMFADMLGDKRFSLVEKYYPATFSLLKRHEQLARVGRNLLGSHLPVQSQQHAFRSIRDAFWFADLLRGLVEEGQITIPHVGHVLEYEQVQLELSQDDTSALSVNEFKARRAQRPSLTPEDVLRARTRVGKHVALREFPTDIVPLVKALVEGQEPPEPSGAPIFILFSKVPGTERAHQARINRMTFDLLKRCDGATTTAAILDAVLDADLPAEERAGLSEGCCGMLLRLYQLDIITFEQSDA
jgi:hypothetical protein